MTDDHLSPAARADEVSHLAEIEAARVAQELAARDAPPPHVRKAKRKPALLSAELADLLAELVYLIRRDELAPLRRRIVDLENRTGLDFKGPWKADSKYLKGDAATHKGGLWVAIAPTSTAKPGESGIWVLAVKSGAAAR